jgi:hypothetical protein
MRRVTVDHLACPTHWRLVSQATRDWVWRAWTRGADDHGDAIRKAIEEMNAA